MIFNLLNFLSTFIAKKECLEHFIAGWNHCFFQDLFVSILLGMSF